MSEQTNSLSPSSLAPDANNLLCSTGTDNNILHLVRDSQSQELQSYNSVATELSLSCLRINSTTDSSTTAAVANCSAPPTCNTVDQTTRASPSAATRRGTNWSAIDRYCFITALDNHNPWIASTNKEALLIWNKALEQANEALAQKGREPRNQGAFEAQWRKLVKDVRAQKSLRLRATGANFDEDALFGTLYNLVDLYSASTTKMAFLKPQDTVEPLLPSQVERIQRQKRKHAVSVAREAGQTGQTLALQRMRARQSASATWDRAESPDTQVIDTDMEHDVEDAPSMSASTASPVQKRRRTAKAQIGESLVEAAQRLIFMQTSSSSSSHSATTQQEVGKIRSQVSQLQSDVAGINGKMDVLIQMLMQQRDSGPAR